MCVMNFLFIWCFNIVNAMFLGLGFLFSLIQRHFESYINRFFNPLKFVLLALYLDRPFPPQNYVSLYIYFLVLIIRFVFTLKS